MHHAQRPKTKVQSPSPKSKDLSTKFKGQSSKIIFFNSSKATPAILVVPANRDFRSLNVTPPFFKLFPAEVMRCWRHQMIENNCVLFAPAKLRNRAQVI